MASIPAPIGVPTTTWPIRRSRTRRYVVLGGAGWPFDYPLGVTVRGSSLGARVPWRKKRSGQSRGRRYSAAILVSEP